jgi:hypothetical protein
MVITVQTAIMRIINQSGIINILLTFIINRSQVIGDYPSNVKISLAMALL